MIQTKRSADRLKKAELMKKILLHKNRPGIQLVKNSILLGTFLEQVKTFINKEVYETEVQNSIKDMKDLVLEGHNNRPAISPMKIKPEM